MWTEANGRSGYLLSCLPDKSVLLCSICVHLWLIIQRVATSALPRMMKRICLFSVVLAAALPAFAQTKAAAKAEEFPKQPDIPPLPAAEQTKPASPGTSLLKAYPDLRPLEQARQGLSQAALRQLERQGDSHSPGVLQLNLSQTSSLNFSSEAGPRSSLKGAQGELVLQLQPPLQLAITPAPKAGEVLWNGQPLPPLDKQPGQYRLPQPVSGRGAAPTPPAPAAAP